MAKPFQFRLRTIFLLTTLVAVGCLVAPPIWNVIAYLAADDDVPFFQFLLFGSLVVSSVAVQIINIVRE
jgi:hypothetical protein